MFSMVNQIDFIRFPTPPQRVPPPDFEKGKKDI